jgi:hypothetical protein
VFTNVSGEAREIREGKSEKVKVKSKKQVLSAGRHGLVRAFPAVG